MSKQIDLEKLRKHAERGVPLGSSQILELVQYIAALEKDAARYEWLRDNCTKSGIVVDVGAGAEIWCTIDEAIDTAMEASNA